jgi:hypothetical protein
MGAAGNGTRGEPAARTQSAAESSLPVGEASGSASAPAQ